MQKIIDIDKKVNLFEKVAIPKVVLKLCVPTILSSLVMVLYSMADTYFVGMLNDSTQNAAVTLAHPVLMSFNAVNNLFGVGSGSLMSRALGSKDYVRARHSATVGLYLAIGTGVLFSLMFTLFRGFIIKILGADDVTIAMTEQYLLWAATFGAVPSILNVVMAYLVRSEGSALHSSIGTMSGCVINMILDPFFILPWGLNMGAAGAGCTTFLSNCMACLYFFVLLRRRRRETFVSFSWNSFRPNRKILREICAVGVPAALANLLTVTGVAILNNFTAGFGAEAVAAMGIALRVDLVPSQICLGLSNGIMPLVSYNYASRNISRIKKAYAFTLTRALLFISVVTVLFYLFAEWPIRLFMTAPTIVQYGAMFLRGFCIALPFYCVDFVTVGVFQACGLGRISFLFTILRKIVLEIPAFFILNKIIPLYGLPYAYLVSEGVLGIVGFLVIVRLFRTWESVNTQKLPY